MINSGGELRQQPASHDDGPMDEQDFLQPSQPLLPQSGHGTGQYHPTGGEHSADGQPFGNLQHVETVVHSESHNTEAGQIVFHISPRLGLSVTLSAVAVNVVLSVLTVVTQVGMTVTLPMFSSALESHIICGQPKPVGDVYFLLLFTAFWFIFFFGAMILIARLMNPDFPLHSSVSHRDRIILGLFNTINGILIVFSSPEDRTPVFLQPVLSTIIIPFTVLASFLLLRKKESIPRLICCLAVIVGLIISTEPVIFNIDGQGSSGSVHTKSIAKFAWSCVFMLGFVPLAVNNVFEEKIVKRAASKERIDQAPGHDADVNALLLVFWINVWTFVMFGVFFWTDFIPVFGTVDGLTEFKAHMDDGFACMFGHAPTPQHYYGTNWTHNCSALTDDPTQYNPDPSCALPVTYCWLFIVFYCLANLFSLMLIKYAAGAVYLVVVQGLITPLGAIFWYLFEMDSTAHLKWHPVYFKTASTFTIIGLLIMVPAVVLYNMIGLHAAKRKKLGLPE